MILITIKEGHDPSSVIERLRGSSSSYKLTKLYGRHIIIAWPDEVASKVVDDSIDKVFIIKRPYPLASREWRENETIVEVENVRVGDKKVIVAAGPCSVEDEELMIDVAAKLKKLGVSMIRGGAFKPRTSPYAFQGFGKRGLLILKRVYDETGLPIISEIMDPRDLELFKEYVHVIQIGARNSQNFPLLKEVGRTGKPVLLKRGFGMNVEEWLLSSEYILLEGNGNVILCERGIRSFEVGTRFTLDLGGAVLAKKLSHLPLCIDPSHPAGKSELVPPLALASIAAGADMLLIEVHPNPTRALSDAEQQLTLNAFRELMEKLRAIASAIGRDL